MVGGMATVAGSVMGAYIGFLGGDDPVERLAFAKSLLAASVMAAPGAVVIAKIIFPQREKIPELINVSSNSVGNNLLNAISNGTTEGVKMAVNVGAMLLVFISLIALLNGIFSGTGDALGLNLWVAQNTPYDQFSIEFVLGYLFAPLMWLIGVAAEDMALDGPTVGDKNCSERVCGICPTGRTKIRWTVHCILVTKSRWSWQPICYVVLPILPRSVSRSGGSAFWLLAKEKT